MLSAQELAGRMRSRARSLVQQLGYDVHKIRAEPTPPAPPTPPEPSPLNLPTADQAIATLIENTNPRAVIDVGANIGQFATWVRDAGFNGEIISFEPQIEEHKVLAGIAEPDADWVVAPRCALGASEGVAQLHLAGNSQSSSLLDMLELHSANAPTSVYVDSVETPVRRLDDVLAEVGFDPADALLKIDTQGFETEVLRGASATLPLVVAAHVELSLAPLYADQALTSEIFALLAAADLELSMVNDGFRTPDGQLLQIDGGFMRMGSGK
ncbi:MAG: FkbM family methyltransferase [Thermoleophilaceae bacterium]|nr:FkbM family methyltransferase [Thermoleophilaceae bacterium]